MNQKSGILAVFILLTIMSSAYSKEWYQQGHPIFLNGKNFERTLRDKQSIKIVKFFTPWCRYCRYMKPILDSFHQQMIAQQANYIKFYQINCQQQKKLCQTFDVTSYPQLKILDFKGNIINSLDGYLPKQQSFEFFYDAIDSIVQDNPQFLKKQDIVERKDQKIEIQIDKIEQKNLKQMRIQSQNSKVIQNSIHKNLKGEQIKSQISILQNQNKIKTQQNEKNKEFQIVITLNQIFRVFIYIIIGSFGGYYLKDILKSTQKLQKQYSLSEAYDQQKKQNKYYVNPQNIRQSSPLKNDRN